MAELVKRYRDAREEAGLHVAYRDGARVEGTTERDTREDYILLSLRLKWSVSLHGYDLKVRPRGLATCRHMVPSLYRSL
jgi:hypothetical protein